jgi:LuxR family maltose regulon positive regulatory protein
MGTSIMVSVDLRERHSHVEVFVNVGSTIVRLLSRLPADEHQGFRQAIVKRSKELFSVPPQERLPDPLTDRELEILSLLPSRLTNMELAKHCYVSVNTIKAHMIHIYRKLVVVNRSEAIAHAREIGLL